MSSAPARQNLADHAGPRHYCWRNSEISPAEAASAMEFYLNYDGILLSSGNNSRRPQEKHDMRRAFHKQLLAYWDSQNVLRNRKTKIELEDGYLQRRREDPDDEFFAEPNKSEAETLANRFTRYGFRFLPLVNSVWNITCDLELTFLQKQLPGDAIFKAGDIDNRIKTLLDALRMPDDQSQVRGFTPETDEDPFYCLLEDDKLISGFCVNMNRLLLPTPDDNPNRVNLRIKVSLRAPNVTYLNMDLIPR